ncbi:MAG TPA: FtsX-like permease family protein, partial [Gemmatimonadaceae bacterium]|nr:FtsX-like permease family protein [Gemmatimonadaceae bacterium]
LLTSVANVATLLLLRAVRRRREIAVRLALGAGRGRLARQLLTESLLLAAAGGAAALLVAAWGGELLRATMLPNLAPGEGAADPRVLAVTALAALAAGVAAGLAPVVRAGSAGAADALRGGASGGESVRRSRMLAGLLLAQTGLSTALLVGAGLFVRSLHNVRSQELGFDPERVLLATFDFRSEPAADQRDAVHYSALERVRALPGVAHATQVESVPFSFHHVLPVSVPGHPEPPTVGGQLPFLNAATPEYFRVIGLRVVDGRPITDADGPSTPPVAVVNETMAHRVWPGERAVGKCFRITIPPGIPGGSASDESFPCREVVGVVRDVRRRSVRPEDVTMQYYVPFEQVPIPFPRPRVSGLLLLARGDVPAAARDVRLAMLAAGGADPDAPLAFVRPLQELIAPQLRPWRLGASAFTAFGALALAMAALGLYAALGYAVAQRAREMGVRAALGATRVDVVRLVLAGALRDAGAGLLLGGAVALAAGRWVAPLLFGVSPRDPLVFGAVAVTLGAVAALAALAPALRAARADPAAVMRAE